MKIVISKSKIKQERKKIEQRNNSIQNILDKGLLSIQD